jgi:hypothetical protein
VGSLFTGLGEVARVMSLPCREHSMLISRDADGEVRRATRVGLRLHYILCAPCRHFAGHLRFFKRAAGRMSSAAVERATGSARMPEDVHRRIDQHLRG